jgi:hypothetical protein
MRRYRSARPVQTDAERFTDFLAERRAIDAVDPIVTFVRGMSHETPIC